MKVYFDNEGNRVFVSSGISGGKVRMTVCQKTGAIGTHRIKSKSLPDRKAREEAQRDLDLYAKTHGWKKA
jgi:hypothetical protein